MAEGFVATAAPMWAVWLFPPLTAIEAGLEGLTVTFCVWVSVRKFAVAETVCPLDSVEL